MKAAKIVGLSLLALVVLLFIVFLIIRAYYNHKASQLPESEVFAAGSPPDPSPNGFWAGTASVNQGSWQGKRFDAGSNSGMNVFTGEDRYNFHSYAGMGLTDKNLQVLKIDYNQAGNPWWLKFIVDEVVQIDPGQMQGKIQLKLIPGLPVTLGYFNLRQSK